MCWHSGGHRSVCRHRSGPRCGHRWNHKHCHLGTHEMAWALSPGLMLQDPPLNSPTHGHTAPSALRPCILFCPPETLQQQGPTSTTPCVHIYALQGGLRPDTSSSRPRHHPCHVCTSMHCRVGTGLTDRQQDQVRERLQPYLEPNTRKNVPKCYKVTGRPQERPDFWVTDPYQSLVLKASWAHFGCSEP